MKQWRKEAFGEKRLGGEEPLGQGGFETIRQ